MQVFVNEFQLPEVVSVDTLTLSEYATPACHARMNRYNIMKNIKPVKLINDGKYESRQQNTKADITLKKLITIFLYKESYKLNFA